MINKKVNNVREALQGIEDGMTIMLGGFGLCGIPENSIAELVQKGISILRIDGRQVGSKQLERTVRDYVDILEQRKPAPPKQQDAMEAPITRGHYFRGIL